MDNKITREVLIQAKKKAEIVLDFIEKMEKQNGSTKESKHVKKVLNDFLHCNLSSQAIYRKYTLLVNTLEKLSGGINETKNSSICG